MHTHLSFGEPTSQLARAISKRAQSLTQGMSSVALHNTNENPQRPVSRGVKALRGPYEYLGLERCKWRSTESVLGLASVSGNSVVSGMPFVGQNEHSDS